jgi:hypothetical protein
MEKGHARSCDHVRDLLARICPYGSDLGIITKHSNPGDWIDFSDLV